MLPATRPYSGRFARSSLLLADPIHILAEPLVLYLAIAAVAFLYSSVGHAGASGYIAVLTLFGHSFEVIRPTALVLNILVAIIGSWQFIRAGHFSWSLTWPFAVLAIPASFVAGGVQLPRQIIGAVIAVVLLFSAVRLFVRAGDPEQVTPPKLPLALALGGLIGFLAGLTGTGGGVFLTPLLLFCGWAKTRTAAATSVVFILINSISGLVGLLVKGGTIPSLAWTLAPIVVVLGTLGSYLGSRKLPVRVIQLLLAAVLISAGVKLLLPTK